MLFYTGKGDKGYSAIGKKKIPKDSPVLEALGDLDELNSFIGFAKSIQRRSYLKEKLQRIQEILFIVQANIAWFLYSKFPKPKLQKTAIQNLEKEIREIEKRIQPERKFIVPGSSSSAAHLDLLRAVARRTERRIYALSRRHRVAPEILTYLNRLSSYLYALARDQAAQKKLKEPHPSYQ